MKPENVCSLLLSASFIKNFDSADDVEFLSSVADFLKVVEATRRQKVTFGHFLHIIESTCPQVRDQFNYYDELFTEKFNDFLTEIRNFKEETEISPESPLGIIFCSNEYEIETAPVFSYKIIIKKYKEWKENKQDNFLTLLLNPDYAFYKKPLPEILSPLPSHVDPSKEITDEEFLSLVKEESASSPQALLYLALKHAEQRKTTLAIEEASRLTLSMSRSDDNSIRSRAAVTLAQIYNILGLETDSVLALNESIDNSKSLLDASILSSAVALKAQIDDSPDMWKHAASLADPHPEATVQATYSKEQSLSSILKLEFPYVAADIYSKMDKESSPLFAAALPPSLRTLPVVIETLAKEGKWREAAKILKTQDFDRIEVRATALALGSLYYDVYKCEEQCNEMRTDLEEILNIDIGHFKEVKDIIRRIMDAFRTPLESSKIPVDKCTLYGIKWVLARLDIGYEIQENTKEVLDSIIAPKPVTLTTDIEELIDALSNDE